MTHIFPRIGRVRSTERSSRRYDLYWASQWSHRNGCALASPALKSTPATLTAWRATPPCMRYQSRRLSPAGTNRPTMTSASASNSRPPSRTRPPCAIATELSSEFLPPGAAGLAHRPVLAAAAGDVRSLAISPRYGIFSTDCRRISPTASSSSSRVFAKGSGTAAQPRAARA